MGSLGQAGGRDLSLKGHNRDAIKLVRWAPRPHKPLSEAKWRALLCANSTFSSHPLSLLPRSPSCHHLAFYNIL